MDGYADNFLYRIRFVIVVLLILASLLSLPFLLSLAAVSPSAHAASMNPAVSTSAEDSPNVITSGLFNGTDQLDRFINSTGDTVNSAFHSVSSSIVSATTTTASVTAHGVGSGVGLMIHTTDKSLNFFGNIIGDAVDFAASISKAGNIIRPA